MTGRFSAQEALSGCRVSGYEIHAGRSAGPALARPFLKLEGRDEGAASADGRIAGAYLHGLFTEDAFRAWILARWGVAASGLSYSQALEDSLDSLAAALEEALDVDALLALAGRPS